jgi:uncharacterized protein YndB with AHSA1/START domain
MLKTILLVLAAGLGLVLLLAAFRPDSFRIERSLVIKAPPEKIYPHLTDFKAWMAWSPWEKKDPALKRTYSGAERGVGSAYAWAGEKAGEGRMEIAEATPASNVRIKIEFLKPLEASNVVDFTLRPEGDRTVVRWSMHGPQPYLNKLAGLFMDIDRLVGRDFEAGLAALKAVAETPA